MPAHSRSFPLIPRSFPLIPAHFRSFPLIPRSFPLIPARPAHSSQCVTESLVIMQLIEAEFPEAPPMLPPAGPLRQRAEALLRLERQLFGAWCDLVFRGSGGRARDAFMSVMGQASGLKT